MIQYFNEKIPFPRKRVIKSAVYLIVCNNSEGVYVGSSGDISKRMVGHRSQLRAGTHENKNLQKLYNTYGDNAFHFKFKCNNYSKEEGLIFEEKFISLYKTVNIAKEPTKGGSPNKGNKLSAEWRLNMHKNKVYKHNKETLEKVIVNNKEGACKLIFRKDSEELKFNSWVEASEYFEVKGIHYFRGNLVEYKGWTIEVITTQKKKVVLEYEDEIKEFNSAGECDRFLDMWRGATSHYLLRDGNICGCKVYYKK